MYLTKAGPSYVPSWTVEKMIPFIERVGSKEKLKGLGIVSDSCAVVIVMHPGPRTKQASTLACQPLYAHPHSMYVVWQLMRLSSINTSHLGDSAPIWKWKWAREAELRSAAAFES